MRYILRCEACKSYGLEKECACGRARQRIKPAKYSPEDKWGAYRRKYKEALDEVEGNSAQCSKGA